MEEQPGPTVAAILAFLDGPGGALSPVRLDAAEIDVRAHGGAGAGTSGVGGIETTLLYGDPAEAGPYAIEIRVPANTRIAPHSHRDSRFAMVVSGEWHFGYGAADPGQAGTLTAGGFYTEPAGAPHFAFTGAAPAVVYITGTGPSDTRFVSAADAPAARHP
ncbi:MAG: cupin domain-containing protein [Sphingomonas sp.]